MSFHRSVRTRRWRWEMGDGRWDGLLPCTLQRTVEHDTGRPRPSKEQRSFGPALPSKEQQSFELEPGTAGPRWLSKAKFTHWECTVTGRGGLWCNMRVLKTSDASKLNMMCKGDGDQNGGGRGRGGGWVTGGRSSTASRCACQRQL